MWKNNEESIKRKRQKQSEAFPTSNGVTKIIEKLPAIIFISVALIQITLTQTSHLSPWRGGGFGMFSTHDSHQDRHLLIRGRTPDGNIHRILVSRQALEDKGLDKSTILRITSMPTDKAMEKFSKLLLSWNYITAGKKELDTLSLIKEKNGAHVHFRSIDTEIKTFLRPIQSRDLIPRTHTPTKLTQVDLSTWVLKIDPNTNYMNWELINHYRSSK